MKAQMPRQKKIIEVPVEASAEQSSADGNIAEQSSNKQPSNEVTAETAKPVEDSKDIEKSKKPLSDAKKRALDALHQKQRERIAARRANPEQTEPVKPKLTRRNAMIINQHAAQAQAQATVEQLREAQILNQLKLNIM